MGLSVKDYIASFLESAPHSLEGERMAESIFQLDGMEAAYHALREAPALERPFAFAQHMNAGLVEATLGDFAPAVPLTPEGLAYAACGALRSEEHTSELQSLMRISYAVFGLTK